MNERIQEIAVEADLLIKKSNGDEFRYGNFDPRFQKFAELIVRECILCCEQVISDPVPKSVDTWLNGGSQCIDEIKEHFGVKE